MNIYEVKSSLAPLGLTPEQYTVVSGAQRVVRGIQHHTHDLDLLVEDARTLGRVVSGKGWQTVTTPNEEGYLYRHEADGVDVAAVLWCHLGPVTLRELQRDRQVEVVDGISVVTEAFDHDYQKWRYPRGDTTVSILLPSQRTTIEEHQHENI